ncbi:MAG: HNH endonuclease [Pseudomonadota bacterium]
MTKSTGILGARATWSEDQLAMLHQFYPGYRTEDLATMIGKSLEHVYRKAKQLGLVKTEAYLASPAASRLRRGDGVGVEYRFQKGHSSWNKGTKGVHTGGEKTQFKPGQAPHNTLPIGSTKFDKSGVLLQKVSDAKGNNSKRWRGVHELVWVAANGPLPAKHIVVFKSGMKTNVFEEITIDRVECISLAENMRRNTVHNMPKELVQLVQLRGALNRQINKRSAT